MSATVCTRNIVVAGRSIPVEALQFVSIPQALAFAARVQNAPRRDHGGGEITSHGERSNA